jgi:hypothetical protein
MICAVIVEGPHDKLFFDKALHAYLRNSGIEIEVLISKGWGTADYEHFIDLFDAAIILRDLDDFACPLKKKDDFCSTYRLHHHKQKVVIAIKEIESWYLAGGSVNLPKLPTRFHTPCSTENFYKEDLKREVTRHYRWDKHETTLVELSKDYSVSMAVSRCSSVKYFFNKLSLLTGVDLQT